MQVIKVQNTPFQNLHYKNWYFLSVLYLEKWLVELTSKPHNRSDPVDFISEWAVHVDDFNLHTYSNTFPAVCHWTLQHK